MSPVFDLRLNCAALAQAWQRFRLGVADEQLWVQLKTRTDALVLQGRSVGWRALDEPLGELARLTADGPLRALEQAPFLDAALNQIVALLQAGKMSEAAPAARVSAANRAEGLVPLVLVCAQNDSTLRDVLVQMEHYGYRFEVEANFRSALAKALDGGAIAMILELPEGMSEPEQAMAAELNAHQLKWFALSPRDDFDVRLRSVRCGALGFFPAPLRISVVAEALDPFAFKSRQEPYRVLVLDDSPTVLAALQKALEPFENIHLHTLREPFTILDVLSDFSPDVLLLDFHMHSCTGLEVAKIIRQNKSFASIPIVFLTSETREEVQLEVMRHGGDDFLTKPIGLTQLLNVVTSKAERYRGLRKLMVEDSLTGLYNHTKTKALLEQALLLAERSQHCVSYAILDIDHFKKVNDSYGHAVGDKVIKSFARLLQQRVRKTDVVGRYGGEEFVVVLYNSSVRDAFELLESVRSSFAQMYHAYDEGIFSVTFSAGLAHYPAYAGMPELMAAADEALYAAKKGGRNRCALAAKSVFSDSVGLSQV